MSVVLDKKIPFKAKELLVFFSTEEKPDTNEAVWLLFPFVDYSIVFQDHCVLCFQNWLTQELSSRLHSKHPLLTVERHCWSFTLLSSAAPTTQLLVLFVAYSKLSFCLKHSWPTKHWNTKGLQ